MHRLEPAARISVQRAKSADGRSSESSQALTPRYMKHPVASTFCCPSLSDGNMVSLSLQRTLPPDAVPITNWDTQISIPRPQASPQRFTDSRHSTRQDTSVPGSLGVTCSDVKDTRSTINSRLSRQTDAASFSSFWDDAEREASIASSRSSMRTMPSIPSRTQGRPHSPSRSASLEIGSPNSGSRPVIKSRSRTTVTYAKPASRLRNRPGEAFKKLPKEIIDMILNQLRQLHLYPTNSQRSTCSTCWLRDACSVALTSKQCYRAASGKIYERIWLVGSDSKKIKRLVLLRSALAKNPELAQHVKELKVWNLAQSVSEDEKEKHMSLISNIVNACPNLERILGLRNPYAHINTRLIAAIVSRSKLTEYVWEIIPAVPAQKGSRWSWSKSVTPGRESKTAASTMEQSKLFIELNCKLKNLNTLAICGIAGTTISSSTILTVVSNLPSLKKLSLSSLSQLSPGLLAALPPLVGLHLHNITGFSTQDFVDFTTKPQKTSSLRSLSLVHVNLVALPLLALLLKKLTSIKRLVLIQDDAPLLDDWTAPQHKLSSMSLEALTWDFLKDNPHQNINATTILADSIASNEFPVLQKIKTANDREGRLQALCKPVAYKSALSPIVSYPPSRKDSGISGVSAINSPNLPTMQALENRSLQQAQIMAQLRNEEARRIPSFKLVIEDYSSSRSPRCLAVFELGGFVGKVGTDSKITYDLGPDVDGKEAAGVLIEDVLRESDERGTFKTCDGKWNDIAEKFGSRTKEARKRGEHRQRENWLPLNVDRLF